MKSILHNFYKKYSSLSRPLLLLILVILVNNKTLNAQSELDVINNSWLQYSDAPNSLYHHITDQAYVLLAQRAENVAKLNTLSEWQQRQKWVRETLMDIVGPFPIRTSLNAKVTRIVYKEFFRVEHIIYESQPGFFVTSSLFIPSGLKKGKKAPVVIYCCGHSELGYRSEVYQHVILNLVNKGFIVFSFDPVGQGERQEYYDPLTKKAIIGGCDKAHSYSGTQAFITGSSQAKYMIWDGIRAVDYLFTRKEVDPSRIGITGRSGGGTQSAYIAAMDDRIIAAAPECYITNFTRLLQTIGNQDAEQNLTNEIIRGIDHADLLSVRAPKPILMITTTRDIFSIQGARETEKEVSGIYKAYGKESNFSRVEDDYPHASTKKNREAMYAFFQKQLNNPGNPVDEEVKPLTPEELQVTASGQLSTSIGGETVFSLNCKEAENLQNDLQASRNDFDNYQSKVLNAAKRLSGVQEPSVINEPVFTGRFQREGYVIEKYFVKGEGNYIIPYLLMVPEQPNHKAVIYLHPTDKKAEAFVGGEMDWFVRNGFMVLAPDLIGVGEMGPGVYQGDSYIDGYSHNLWYASMLIGRSIVGIRAGDVIRLTRLLKERFEITEVYGVARKEMAPVLLHAAAFDATISQVALIEPYSSYRSIVMHHFYNSAFVQSAVPGALEAYDLPDLEAILAPRRLMMIGVTDGDGKNTETESMVNDLNIVKKGYHSRNADGQLNIIALKPGEKPIYFFKEWIK